METIRDAEHDVRESAGRRHRRRRPDAQPRPPAAQVRRERARAGPRTATREIVIWNNALDRRHARVSRRRSTTRGSGSSSSEKNIGQNALRAGVRADDRAATSSSSTTTSSTHRGTGTRCCSTRSAPAARSASSPPTSRTIRTTSPRSYRYHVRPHEYTLVERERRRLLQGPDGRRLRDDVARALRPRRRLPPALRRRSSGRRRRPTSRTSSALGFGAAVLADLRVHHTGGPYYSVDVEGEGRVLAAATGRCARGGQRSSGCCSASRSSAG